MQQEFSRKFKNMYSHGFLIEEIEDSEDFGKLTV